MANGPSLSGEGFPTDFVQIPDFRLASLDSQLVSVDGGYKLNEDELLLELLSSHILMDTYTHTNTHILTNPFTVRLLLLKMMMMWVGFNIDKV